MIEEWKTIDCEPNYEVSNLGNVRSKERLVNTLKGVRKYKSRPILKRISLDEYVVVHLGGFNEKRRIYKVHRLVAKAFLPNPDNLPFINHKDESKNNNCVNNLEWCTAKYNVNYGTAQARRISKISKKVNAYDLKGNFVKSFISIRECARCLSVCNSNVKRVISGKAHTCRGYVIRFEGQPFSLNRNEKYDTRTKTVAI